MDSTYGYLFVFFTGENTEKGEQIYFALSRDGMHWTDCQEPEHPVLTSSIGEKGVRDPFMIRAYDGSGYYLIATDLRIATGKGWADSVTNGSRNLILWHSDNLVDWSGPEPVELAIPSAGCLWAPEVIFDGQKKEYFIFFASNVKEKGESEPRQRIYCSRTKDFKVFSPAEKYIEKENHVIDTTMVYDNGRYYRFSKNETTKHIDMDVSGSIDGAFTSVDSKTLRDLYGVEGPEIYRLPDGRWCLIVDRFATHGGYLPLIADDLGSGNFRIAEENEFDMGTCTKRHGGVLALNKDEYQALEKKYLTK